MTQQNSKPKRFRSQDWFDNEERIDMTALYLERFMNYGLTADKLALAKPDAIVMHPGPMNRGVEIDSSVADGPHSVILPQVTFGIAVRMAVMSIVAGN